MVWIPRPVAEDLAAGRDKSDKTVHTRYRVSNSHAAISCNTALQVDINHKSSFSGALYTYHEYGSLQDSPRNP